MVGNMPGVSGMSEGENPPIWMECQSCLRGSQSSINPHHHHKRFCPHIATNDVLKLYPFRTFKLDHQVFDQIHFFLSFFPRLVPFLVKGSQTISINLSFPVDILLTSCFKLDSWKFDLSFIDFSFVLVHKPPMHNYLLNARNFSHILNYPQCQFLAYIRVIALHQYSIRFTQRCPLGMCSGSAMNISVVVAKTYPSGTHIHILHTGETCCPFATPFF